MKIEARTRTATKSRRMGTNIAAATIGAERTRRLNMQSSPPAASSQRANAPVIRRVDGKNGGPSCREIATTNRHQGEPNPYRLVQDPARRAFDRHLNPR